MKTIILIGCLLFASGCTSMSSYRYNQNIKQAYDHGYLTCGNLKNKDISKLEKANAILNLKNTRLRNYIGDTEFVKRLIEETGQMSSMLNKKYPLDKEKP